MLLAGFGKTHVPFYMHGKVLHLSSRIDISKSWTNSCFEICCLLIYQYMSFTRRVVLGKTSSGVSRFLDLWPLKRLLSPTFPTR